MQFRSALLQPYNEITSGSNQMRTGKRCRAFVRLSVSLSLHLLHLLDTAHSHWLSLSPLSLSFWMPSRTESVFISRDSLDLASLLSLFLPSSSGSSYFASLTACYYFSGQFLCSFLLFLFFSFLSTALFLCSPTARLLFNSICLCLFIYVFRRRGQSSTFLTCASTATVHPHDHSCFLLCLLCDPFPAVQRSSPTSSVFCSHFSLLSTFLFVHIFMWHAIKPAPSLTLTDIIGRLFGASGPNSAWNWLAVNTLLVIVVCAALSHHCSHQVTTSTSPHYPLRKVQQIFVISSLHFQKDAIFIIRP